MRESPPSGWHDGHGTDRLLACGAVLTDIWLAVRTEGRSVTVRFATDADRPDLVAELTVGDPLPPTVVEADQYAVINGVRPARAVHPGIARAAAWCPGVTVRPVDGGFVVSTAGNGRLDRVRAGAVCRSVSLAATAAGLGVSPMMRSWRDGGWLVRCRTKT